MRKEPILEDGESECVSIVSYTLQTAEPKAVSLTVQIDKYWKPWLMEGILLLTALLSHLSFCAKLTRETWTNFVKSHKVETYAWNQKRHQTAFRPNRFWE